MNYTKKHIEDLVTDLEISLNDLGNYNTTESSIRCRDLSIAYTHLEECILRLQKYHNS